MENSIRKLLEKNKGYKFFSPYGLCKICCVMFFLSSLSVSLLNSHVIVENHMKLPISTIAYAYFDKKYSKVNKTIISNFWIGLWVS